VLEAKGLHGCELTMERGAREGRLGMYPSLMDRNGEGVGRSDRDARTRRQVVSAIGPGLWRCSKAMTAKQKPAEYFSARLPNHESLYAKLLMPSIS
jgi:hypothetical protein